MFHRALKREADGFDGDDLVQAERELGIAREELLPARTHRVVTDQPRPTRVDAHDVFVFRPGQHHRVDVLGLEGAIERDRRVLRRGENRWRAWRAHWLAVF